MMVLYAKINMINFILDFIAFLITIFNFDSNLKRNCL